MLITGCLVAGERNCQYLWIKIFCVTKGSPEVLIGRVVGDAELVVGDKVAHCHKIIAFTELAGPRL